MSGFEVGFRGHWLAQVWSAVGADARQDRGCYSEARQWKIYIFEWFVVQII